MEYFFNNLDMTGEIIIGSIAVIFALITFTRFFGLKSFAKMTGFDFVITLIIGNIAGMTINLGQPKLLIGIFIIFILYLINYLLTRITYFNPIIESAFSNKPILLLRNGEINHKNMKKTGVTIDELRAKLREANVLRLSQAKAVILETTGDVSVLHEDDTRNEIDDFLLEGIIR